MSSAALLSSARPNAAASMSRVNEFLDTQPAQQLFALILVDLHFVSSVDGETAAPLRAASVGAGRLGESATAGRYHLG